MPFNFRSARLLLLLMGAPILGLAQNQPDPQALEAYKSQCRQLVSFLQFTFNTLGDPKSPARDKETIINQSYLKVFRDGKVQVEDDLAENRATITNKDVQAYLKDIDFFFTTAVFDFQVEQVTHEIDDQGRLFFIISVNRNLRALTIEGDSINNSQPRFVEVNLDPEKQDLKIVSIYTTRISERESLAEWWNTLTPDWKKWFGGQVMADDTTSFADLLAVSDSFRVGDTLKWIEAIPANVSLDTADSGYLEALRKGLEMGDSFWVYRDHVLALNTDRIYADLRTILSKESIDLTGFPGTLDLTPLSQMTQLRQVNLQGTRTLNLTPLRNLTRLEILNAGNTLVSDLSPLRFASSLRSLDLRQSPIRDLSSLAFFPKLQDLNLSGCPISTLAPIRLLNAVRVADFSFTQISDLSPVSGWKDLHQLTLTATLVSDLSPISNLFQLEVLEMNQMPVQDLGPLRSLQSLRLLFCEGSRIYSLSPLSGLPSLTKVYCDNTAVQAEEARRFMQVNPKTLVVYASATRNLWWSQMSPAWQQVFRRYVPLTGTPGREALQEMANIPEVDITGRRDILDLNPLVELVGLTSLKASYTGIRELNPISDLMDLKELRIEGTQVSDLGPIARLRKLEVLAIGGTPVSSLQPLSGIESLTSVNADSSHVDSLVYLRGLSRLREVYCDGCMLTDNQARDFLVANPEALLVYKTAKLKDWWEGLPSAWQLALNSRIAPGATPSREQLASIVRLNALSLVDIPDIVTLLPLQNCLVLKYLQISGTSAEDLSPLAYLQTLESLEITRNPVKGLEPVSMLPGLKRLVLSQTPVSDITPLGLLPRIEELILAGTQVKKIKTIANLQGLRTLDISGSDVKSLSPLDNLSELTRLLIFNTRISSKKVQKFRNDHPNCEVVYY